MLLIEYRVDLSIQRESLLEELLHKVFKVAFGDRFANLVFVIEQNRDELVRP
jgi:hypothetical protein